MSQPPTLANAGLPEGNERYFYSLDASFRFVFVSTTAERLWSQPSSALIGRDIWEAFPTAKQSDGYARHLKAMRDRTVEKYQIFSPRFQKTYAFTLRPVLTGGLVCFFEET